MPFLLYFTTIEQPQPDEQEAIDGIIKGMTQQTETFEKREHHAVRASHAKSSGCVIGDITVAAGLPPELAQGLFAEVRSYPIAIRLAQVRGSFQGQAFARGQ